MYRFRCCHNRCCCIFQAVYGCVKATYELVFTTFVSFQVNKPFKVAFLITCCGTLCFLCRHYNGVHHIVGVNFNTVEYFSHWLIKVCIQTSNTYVFAKPMITKCFFNWNNNRGHNITFTWHNKTGYVSGFDCKSSFLILAKLGKYIIKDDLYISYFLQVTMISSYS